LLNFDVKVLFRKITILKDGRAGLGHKSGLPRGGSKQGPRLSQ
jgi:hypothetical protein